MFAEFSTCFSGIEVVLSVPKPYTPKSQPSIGAQLPDSPNLLQPGQLVLLGLGLRYQVYSAGFGVKAAGGWMYGLDG